MKKKNKNILQESHKKLMDGLNSRLCIVEETMSEMEDRSEEMQQQRETSNGNFEREAKRTGD